MIKIIDKLPDNNLEKTFFWETAFKLRDLLKEQKIVNRGDAIKAMDLNKKAATQLISDETVLGLALNDVSLVENILFMNYGDKHEIPPRTVIFMNADEQYRIPEEANNPNVVKIFKQYCPDHPKLFPMPLGVPVGFNTNQPIPILEREIDVCFMGQLAANRKEIGSFAEQVSGTNIQSFVGLTSGFNRGISRSAYSDIVRNSKIALCPSGTASTETFRLYEAAVAGCLIITVEQEKNWVYNGLPAVYYQKGENLLPYVKSLLSKSNHSLIRRSDDVRGFYHERWRPSQVAEKLFSILREGSK